jgi:hypothetical protein
MPTFTTYLTLERLQLCYEPGRNADAIAEFRCGAAGDFVDAQALAIAAEVRARHPAALHPTRSR